MKKNQRSWLSEDEIEILDVIANDRDRGVIDQQVEYGELAGWEAAFMLGEDDAGYDDAS